MRSCSMAELKAHQARIMKEASDSGEEILLTSHGQPVAVVTPINPEDVEWSLRPEVRARLAKALEERVEARTTRGRKG